eukprot:PITA_10693
MDSIGHSGGLAIGYKDGRMKIVNQWGMNHAMGIEIESPEFGFPLVILNIYGPCQGRVNFWNDLLSKSIVKCNNLVMGGDLNFSIGSAEAWGPSAREDPLSDFFLNSLNSNNLKDVNPIKLKPTWRNQRVGEARIAKILDRFLLSEELTSRIPMFKQWVGEGGSSDHFPIYMELSKPPRKPAAPFKFNASWLQEDSFNNLFRETWRHPGRSSSEERGFLFMENLKRLKKATIEWAKSRKQKRNEELFQINEELQRLESTESDGYASQESKEKISRLKNTKIKFFWLERRNGEVIKTPQSFPRYVEEEEADNLMCEVTKEEVESVIKSMARDKSPGSDGWTIELFQHFFNQIGIELTEVIEESRRKGEVYHLFNATFIALIPTTEIPESFEYFRPISLCNSIYKIIAKVIAVRIKLILSRCISNEQFGFLDGRQIHEAIGVAHETLHSVKLMNRKGVVIKIDLSKAYDRTNWIYLRMLLTHLGFTPDFINWIMGCITSVSFGVLINGASTPFFKGKRGLRQGCPLSPLLFLLVIEGLSQLIQKAKREGKVKGLEVAVNMFISHLLFVDDILVFSNGNTNEIKELKNILELFMKATGMQINFRKSQLILEGLNRQEKAQIFSFFPFDMRSMETPFKYLGFWLKPNAYKKKDWNWLIAKIEDRISHWSYKWLSRAGRLTLIKSVLLAMPVYWAALTWVPKGILDKIRRICSRFL